MAWLKAIGLLRRALPILGPPVLRAVRSALVAHPAPSDGLDRTRQRQDQELATLRAAVEQLAAAARLQRAEGRRLFWMAALALLLGVTACVLVLLR